MLEVPQRTWWWISFVQRNCWNWLGILCKRPQVTSKTPAKPKWSKWLSGRSTCRSSEWDLQPNQDQVSFSPQVRTPSPCLRKNMSWTNVNEDHLSLNPGHPAKKKKHVSRYHPSLNNGKQEILPFGKLTVCYGQSPSFIAKSSHSMVYFP